MCTVGACLLIYPKATADGIRNGLELLGNSLIPSLFPFMVLSSYITQSGVAQIIGKLFEKPFSHIFKTNGYGVVPWLSGLLGGYPVGAKTVAELYTDNKISQSQAQRLLYWCVNPSPAFTVTAVGTFMLGNTESGLILYASCVLSSLTVGFLCRFLSDGEAPADLHGHRPPRENAFASSVSNGGKAMLSVCGWVLTFSVLCALCEPLNLPQSVASLIRASSEVTTGCKNVATQGMSLPVMAAVTGFGGFAVICQCGVYSSACGLKSRYLLCSRILNSALGTIYCALLLKVFPQCETVGAVISTPVNTLPLYHSMGAAVILMAMCLLLILEVDNRKKVC